MECSAETLKILGNSDFSDKTSLEEYFSMVHPNERDAVNLLLSLKLPKEEFEKMNFRNLPKDYFLFGSFKESKLGNRGNNQTLPDFIPGPTHINRDTATRRWETIVKLGLGIKNTMYSIKKYGGNKKSAAGISIDAIQGVFGHSEKETTLIYLTNQDEINRQEVIDKSPDF